MEVRGIVAQELDVAVGLQAADGGTGDLKDNVHLAGLQGNDAAVGLGDIFEEQALVLGLVVLVIVVGKAQDLAFAAHSPVVVVVGACPTGEFAEGLPLRLQLLRVLLGHDGRAEVGQ